MQHFARKKSERSFLEVIPQLLIGMVCSLFGVKILDIDTHNILPFLFLLLEMLHPYDPRVGGSVVWLVCWSVCHKGQEDSLPCSFRSTCLYSNMCSE